MGADTELASCKTCSPCASTGVEVVGADGLRRRRSIFLACALAVAFASHSRSAICDAWRFSSQGRPPWRHLMLSSAQGVSGCCACAFGTRRTLGSRGVLRHRSGDGGGLGGTNAFRIILRSLAASARLLATAAKLHDGLGRSARGPCELAEALREGFGAIVLTDNHSPSSSLTCASVSRRRLTSSARSNVGSAAKGGSALQEAHPEGNTATVMMVMTMTTTTRTTMMMTVVMTMMTMMTMAMMMRMRRVDSCAQSRSTSVDVLVLMSW